MFYIGVDCCFELHEYLRHNVTIVWGNIIDRHMFSLTLFQTSQAVKGAVDGFAMQASTVTFVRSLALHSIFIPGMEKYDKILDGIQFKRLLVMADVIKDEEM